MVKLVFRLFVVVSPWPVKRWVLQKFFGFKLARNARIGISWIFPRRLIMEPGSRIGHLNVAIHLEDLILKEFATIGRGNWITGFEKGNAKHFTHRQNRNPQLKIGRHSAITKNHHIDCTDQIVIGDFSTIAGYHSQLLTHSIDVSENRQDCRPITIGAYCFVGTNVTILGGGSLPSRSVLGAKALLNKNFHDEWVVYGGIPAKPVATIAKDGKYFSRVVGYVD
jgi:acetyltransferase-like isoleucine patch superfamily enzyme